MKETISKELLSEVLNILPVEEIGVRCDNNVYYRPKGCEKTWNMINIHELANKCLICAWSKRYEINPRIMGASIMSLEDGEDKKIIQREAIENPKWFDPRFAIKAFQWILDNNDN